MGLHPDQREMIEKRIDELGVQLAEREAIGDMEGWNKLFKEQSDLKRRLEPKPAQE